MSKAVNLYDVVKVLSVPELEASLLYKVKELQTGAAAEKTSSFEKGIEIFREFVFDGPRRDTNVDTSGMYWFVMFRSSEAHWITLKVEPVPVVEDAPVVPEDFIKDMAGSLVDEVAVNYRKDISSQTREGSFDLTFMHPSRYLICGVIKERTAPGVRIESFDHKEDLEIAFKTMFYYMQKYKPAGDYLFNEFFLKVKPIIDGAVENRAGSHEMGMILED